jgi:hypothetical protein
MLAGTMARGAPKNPINDIVDTVGGWLGGRGPGTNPQVQAAMDATRAIGKVVDTATGGFGQALLSDAQRMAMTGSSTPSALYKTAAVNLGAAAAGVGAAKVAGKVVRDVVPAVAVARNAPRGNLAAQRGLLHGTSQKFKPGDVILPASKLPNKPVWNVSNPNVAYATSDQTFALKAANTARFQRVTQNKGLMSGLLNPRVEKGIPVRESVGELGAKGYNKLVRSNRARIYEVEPVNPATVKINKVDKIREKQSAEGFIVKREVFRGPVFDKQFPKAVKKYRGGGTKKR